MLALQEESIEARIEKRHVSCGQAGKVTQFPTCGHASTLSFLCGLFFLCLDCASRVFASRWKRLFSSVIAYAISNCLHCVFFTLSQKPFAVASEGVDVTGKRWRKFLQKRIGAVSQADFERELLVFETELRNSGASEKEIRKKLSRQRWAWRWLQFRERVFRGDSKALSWFEEQTKTDLERDGREGHLFNKIYGRELRKAEKRLKSWLQEKVRYEEEVWQALEENGKLEGKTDKQVKQIIQKKIRDRYCRVSGWIEAGARRVEVKASEQDELYFHIHVLAVVAVPLPKIVLSLLWAGVASGCKVTDIRKVDVKGNKVAAYVSKVISYSAKEGDESLSEDQKMELQVAFYRRKLVSRIGWNADGLREFEEEKTKERVCRCCGIVEEPMYKGVVEHRDYKVGEIIESTVYCGKDRVSYCWKVVQVDEQGLILEEIEDPYAWQFEGVEPQPILLE